MLLCKGGLNMTGFVQIRSTENHQFSGNDVFFLKKKEERY